MTSNSARVSVIKTLILSHVIMRGETAHLL